MKLAVPIAALLCLLSVSPLHAAACTMNLRYENGAIHWDAVDGATNYTVLETYGEDAVRVFGTKENTFKVAHRASTATKVRYIVTATLAPGIRSAEVESNDACWATMTIELEADAAFRKFTRRAILPIVGSTPGSFGGRFKTALTLRPSTSAQHGRLIFHPAGVVASDSDPSIPYTFASSTEAIVFDDVVAAMRQSGIGSLDIVPDDDSISIVPQVEARLYNDTSIGTFGTFANAVYPYDYLRAAGMAVEIPDDRFRVNVGFRTLTDTTMTILIYSTDRRLLHFRHVDFPAGWMQMTSASDFAGRALTPGQSLQVTFTGSVIPFHTITENKTNDPTLIVAPFAPSSRNVGEYID